MIQIIFLLNLYHIFMNTVKNYLTEVIGIKGCQSLSDTIFCFHTTVDSTITTNQMEKDLDWFAFSLIREGTCRILFNGNKITLSAFDLIIYTPGVTIEILEVSPDYKGTCILINYKFITNNLIIHDFIKDAYFKLIHLGLQKFNLSHDSFKRLENELENFLYYQNSNIKYRTEASLFNFFLFLIDLLNSQDLISKQNTWSSREEEITLQFFMILPEFFLKYHNIKFYADKMKLSKVYLSRIIKNVTGKTVINHIESLLLTKAQWLLLNTDKTIKEISYILNFSDQASFNKFFKRMTNRTPTAYRKNNNNEYSII